MSFCTDQCLLLPRLMLKQLLYRYKNKHLEDSYSLMPMPLLHQWHYSTSIGTFFPIGNCSIQGSLLGKITECLFSPSSVKATTQKGSYWLSSSLIFQCCDVYINMFSSSSSSSELCQSQWDCLPEAHIFKHLFSTWGNCLWSGGKLRRWSLARGSSH